MIVRCGKNSGTGIYSELSQADLAQVWVSGADQDVAETLARFQSRVLLEGSEIARTDYSPIDEREILKGRAELDLGPG